MEKCVVISHCLYRDSLTLNLSPASVTKLTPMLLEFLSMISVYVSWFGSFQKVRKYVR